MKILVLNACVAQESIGIKKYLEEIIVKKLPMNNKL